MMGMETERIEIVEVIIDRLMKTYDACDRGRHNMLTLSEKARWVTDTDELVEKSQRLSRLCEGFMREIQGLYELKKLMGEEKKEIKIEIEYVDSSWNRPNNAKED
jgi:hypothetical protein